jgi:hypothetical protein
MTRRDCGEMQKGGEGRYISSVVAQIYWYHISKYEVLQDRACLFNFIVTIVTEPPVCVYVLLSAHGALVPACSFASAPDAPPPFTHGAEVPPPPGGGGAGVLVIQGARVG